MSLVGGAATALSAEKPACAGRVSLGRDQFDTHSADVKGLARDGA
jgi:hypothetical protein